MTNPTIQYANDLYNFWLRSKEGPENALKIAKKNMENSDPGNWKDLPVGPVFHTKGFGSDKWDLQSRDLYKTHNFWTNVYYILKKKFKRVTNGTVEV